MNGKKGLSRIMSALLAATSMVGGVSARRKKVVKKANSADVVLDSGNKKKVPLSAGSKVVSWIKEHPKTSAGLGFAGLSAIGYGGYKGYKLWYNNEWNKYYRVVFSERTFANYYNQVEKCKGRFKFGGGKVFDRRENEGKEVIFSCDVDNTEHRSLLSAVVMLSFLSSCYVKLTKRLSPVWLELAYQDGIFCSFSEIETKYRNVFLWRSIGIEIKGIVKFYRNFAERYKEKLVDELVKYGEKENKKMVVGNDGEVNVASSA